MKKVLFCISLSMWLVITGCFMQRQPASQNTIVGKWILVATLSDPGDGSSKWVPAPAGQGQQVNFDSSGHITGTALSEATYYQVTDSSHLAISLKGNAAPVTYRYHISGDTLELNPPCREPCGMRLTKLK